MTSEKLAMGGKERGEVPAAVEYRVQRKLLLLLGLVVLHNILQQKGRIHRRD